VLGLPEQVGGDEFHVGVVVGDHGDLRRPGQQVDAHAAEQLALGFGDVGVAGADDHVHRRLALEAERHGRHRLHAAEREDAVRAAQVGGVEHRRVAGAAAARRGAREHGVHARDLRHQHGHERAGHQRAVTGGQVGADAADRDLAVAHDQAGRDLPLEVRGGPQLQLGEAAHPLQAELQALADARVDGAAGSVELLARGAERLRPVAVELLRVAPHRIHAVAVDVEQHRRYAVDDLRVAQLLPRRDPLFEVVRLARQWQG
jgi:hypothetical protein